MAYTGTLSSMASKSETKGQNNWKTRWQDKTEKHGSMSCATMKEKNQSSLILKLSELKQVWRVNFFVRFDRSTEVYKDDHEDNIENLVHTDILKLVTS